MKPKTNGYDVIVVGGGHAGIEAASAAARMGMKTALVTLQKNKIGLMSCNPAIGGLAKGQLVREIDALGGIMGRITDEAGIHFKMLNRSKGPAVQSPRAQTDRLYYARTAQKYLAATPNLTVIEEMVVGIELENGRIAGVRLKNNTSVKTRSVILTAGTFLNGVIYIGMKKMAAGRAGELPAVGLTNALTSIGFEAGRLKTGTPPRIHRDSIDYSRVEVQAPDVVPQPFSFATKKIEQRQINCHIAYTTPETHDILRQGFDRSPLFKGLIHGTGPRYCPSIEDKINRFADKPRHQLFLEPEGYSNIEVYVNGFSTSLPEETQINALKSIPGLEQARIIRLGYAVEYDYFPPHQIYNTMETKAVENLYFAGQINGTSGYEEAAAQGLLAGINAALKLQGKPPLTLGRHEAYIGVLVDDLISKTHNEPYRLFTSRAEFRLLLRQNNADLRLMEYGRSIGLIEDATYEGFLKKKEQIQQLRKEVEKTKILPEAFNTRFLNKSSQIKQAFPVLLLVKRPEVSLKSLLDVAGIEDYGNEVIEEVEFNAKHEGYIRRQIEQIEKIKKMENKPIPETLDYTKIKALSAEAREKLIKVRPENLGQASRISGVSPADVSVLVIYIEKHQKMNVPRETRFNA